MTRTKWLSRLRTARTSDTCTVAGLYLDFLEEKARKKIFDILANRSTTGPCPPTADVAECILPYLPFTTINVTELATWSASNTQILNVNSNKRIGAGGQPAVRRCHGWRQEGRC
jgi:hypothetical protein